MSTLSKELRRLRKLEVTTKRFVDSTCAQVEKGHLEIKDRLSGLSASWTLEFLELAKAIDVGH